MLHYIKLYSILNIRNSSTAETQSISMYLLKPTLKFDIIHKSCETTKNLLTYLLHGAQSFLRS